MLRQQERDTERVERLLGCFTSGLNNHSEALSTYPCHLQTLQTLTPFPACPYRAIREPELLRHTAVTDL